MEPFRHTLRVRWGECDEQGVVYFVNYAEYVDLALTELWRERVRPYAEMVAAGTDLMVVAMDTTFRRPARFDEEVDGRPRGRAARRDVADQRVARRARRRGACARARSPTSASTRPRRSRSASPTTCARRCREDGHRHRGT
jgi:hypothetical protein